MDLGLQRFDRFALADDFAVLMVGVAARQAASPAAVQHVRIATQTAPAVALLSPSNGAFNSATARSLASWRNE